MSASHMHIHKIRPLARVSGFTLIELMITVAVVGILMAIAVASYDFAMVKARRGAAEGCLMEGAQYMERFYTTNFAYDKDKLGADVVLPSCSTDVNTYYTVQKRSAAARVFVLEAIPRGSQATADTKCGTLTVNQAGQKTISGSGQTSACW